MSRYASLALSSMLIGVILALFGTELVLRSLPVSEGARPQSVDAHNPIRRLEPHRTFLWSSGWRFEILNEVRTNNYGFVNDHDYDAGAASPLLALIGDSYVEALMVPFRDTVAGRFASETAPAERVYSFGTSGSPLSSYLAYAGYVRTVFRPHVMAFIIIGNDFDESLLKYKQEPGHSYFVEGPRGDLTLQRIDYEPSRWRTLLRQSSLVRYLTLNTGILDYLLKWQYLPLGKRDETLRFVGNTGADANATRVADSQRVVDAFLEAIPEVSGLPPDRIVFAVDGMRPHLYAAASLQLAKGSYFDLMRDYFMDHARQKGFEVVDLQPRFIEHFAKNGKYFEFPVDSHWNAFGHEVCFEALSRSVTYTWFRGLSHSAEDHAVRATS